MRIPIPAYQSLDKILRDVLGNYTPAQKDQILQANNLDWPYLVDSGESTSAPASGTVLITWTAAGGGSLPAGTVVEAPTYQGQSRQYLTQTALTFPSAGQTQSVVVVCTIDGEWGNTAPYTVTQIPAYATTCTVTNPSPITGGYAYHVLRPGDFLWIPDTFLPNPNLPAETVPLYQQTVGGTDWATTPDGGMQWAVNDLATVQGSQSLLQNAAHRIRTPLGSLWWNPQIGSLVYSVIGRSGPTQSTKIAALSLAAVKQDARLGAVAIKVDTLAEDPTYWQVSIASEIDPRPYTTVL